jgi:hypothetical protein
VFLGCLSDTQTELFANNVALLTGTSIATTLSTNGTQWAEANTLSQVALGSAVLNPVNETLTFNKDVNLKASVY